MSQGLYINLVQTKSLLHPSNIRIRDAFEKEWGYSGTINQEDIPFLKGMRSVLDKESQEDIDKIIELLYEHEQLAFRIQ